MLTIAVASYVVKLEQVKYIVQSSEWIWRQPFKHASELCMYYYTYYILRDFARLLVRYTNDTEDLMKQLRKRNERRSENEETDILYHILIKKMPGMYSYTIVESEIICSTSDVAEEALYRSVVHDGRIDYRNTKILLLNELENSEPEQESNM